MAYGQRGHLALSFQDSFGASNVASHHFVPVVSESLAEEIGQIVEDTMYARLAESPVHAGLRRVTGELRTEAHPVHLGVLLKAALGAAGVTAQGSAFLHEFLPAAQDWDARAALPPFTAEVHRDVGSAFLYSDLLGNTLELEIAHGQLLACTLAVLGGQCSRAAAATPAFAGGRPWSWDVASASYNGAAIADLRQVSISFDNRLSAGHTLSGGAVPWRILREGPQTVSVEGSFLLADQVLFSDFIEQTERRLLLSFRGETVAQSHAAELTLDLPRLRFSEMAPQLRGPGAVEVSFKGRGVYDATSGYALRVTLVNTQAAY